jgi:predicted NUDIX family NTP pyrophosphohydrolase
VQGPLVDLGHVDYTRSKKRVHAFAGPAPDGAAPRCASWEVDKAEFIELSRARRIIHPDQAVLLDRLERLLGVSSQALKAPA